MPGVGRERVDALLVLAAGFALSRDDRDALGAIEGQASSEDLAVDRGRGADAKGVALAAPHGNAMVERGPLGGLQVGREDRNLSVGKPCQRSPSDLIGFEPPRTPGLHGFIGRVGRLSSNLRSTTGQGAAGGTTEGC
ncbi:hypothetical protein ABT382_34450 [Streptomyces pharetrae]|uniref:hypothetical protein n=1 Tax=Streptomyces pharetrae TaxID=291370 RepID=UPI00334DB131